MPEQDSADLLPKLRRHLDAHGFNAVQITQLGVEHPARTTSDSPFVDLVTATAASRYEKSAVVAPMSGGSGPMYPFVQYLGVPIANAGIGRPESNAHAPNEHVYAEEFLCGAKRIARILVGLTDLYMVCFASACRGTAWGRPRPPRHPNGCSHALLCAAAHR